MGAQTVLADRKMCWRHSSLNQNFLLFAAALVKRGSEQLAKTCVRMGVGLSEVDANKQTQLSMQLHVAI